MRGFGAEYGHSGSPYLWDLYRRAVLRAELDARIAKLYGLTTEDLRYLLDPTEVMGDDYPSETFRVLKDNERKNSAHTALRALSLMLGIGNKLGGQSGRP